MEKKPEPRVDWVSTSSDYKKEEVDQPGAPKSKKITKVGRFSHFFRLFCSFVLSAVLFVSYFVMIVISLSV